MQHCILSQNIVYFSIDCKPRSTDALALGKGVPVKLLTLNIKTK